MAFTTDRMTAALEAFRTDRETDQNIWSDYFFGPHGQTGIAMPLEKSVHEKLRMLQDALAELGRVQKSQ